MANTALKFLFATAFLIVIGLHGCDAFLRLIPLQCPYWNGFKHCHPLGKPQCNATSCANEAMCCTLSCGGARCLSRRKLCPQVQQGDTASCTTEQRKKQCYGGCKAASCCSNNCGGTSCLSKDKHGTCPAVPTGAVPCPFVLSPTTCATDTNCAGDQKCCNTKCFQDQCTTPD
jgi:hypothetical protein